MTKPNDVRVRRTTMKDAEFLFRLRNDPDVRRNFISMDRVTHPNHLRWLTEAVRDTDRMLLVAVNHADCRIGQIRFDLEDGVADVSISICRRFRGKGYGIRLLQSGISYLKKNLKAHPSMRIRAKIKRANAASIATFRKAGFFAYAGSKDFIILRRAL
jgi:RimJ/RimL family protein N-acetyltransferase